MFLKKRKIIYTCMNMLMLKLKIYYNYVYLNKYLFWCAKKVAQINVKLRTFIITVIISQKSLLCRRILSNGVLVKPHKLNYPMVFINYSQICGPSHNCRLTPGLWVWNDNGELDSLDLQIILFFSFFESWCLLRGVWSLILLYGGVWF